MSQPSASVGDDKHWEKVFAPPVRRREVVLAFVLFAVWLLFLGGVAFHRWFISLQ